MKKNDIARAHAEPSNWSITSNDGTNVVAKNIKSGVAYSGTTAAFNQMIATPVLMDEAAHFNPARNAFVHPETGEDVSFGGGSSGITAPLLRMASIHNRVNTSVLAAATATMNMSYYDVRTIGSGDLKSLRLKFDNAVVKLAGTIDSCGNSFTINKAWLMNGYGGTLVQLYFNGKRSRTVGDGEIDVLSDPVYPTQFSLSTFAKNTAMYVMYEISVTTGQNIPITEGSDNAIAGNYFDPTATTPTYSASGVTFAGTAPTQTYGFSASLVGEYVTGDPRTWMMLGDSIFLNPDSMSYGYVAMTGATKLSGILMGRVRGQAFSQNYNPTYLQNLLKYVSGVVEEYGENTTGNLQAMKNYSLELWDNIRNNQVSNSKAQSLVIIRTKLLARTTGTFASTAGQTVEANHAAGTNAELFNTWLDTQVGVGNGPTATVDATVGVAGTLRADTTYGATNWYKWAFTPAVCTWDGIHPNTAGAIIGAGNIKPTLLRYP